MNKDMADAYITLNANGSKKLFLSQVKESHIHVQIINQLSRTNHVDISMYISDIIS